MTFTLVFLFLAIFFSAFFSGMEIAFVSANKLKIELDKKQGGWSAKILSGFIQNPAKFISAMLLGNNIALVIYGMLMAKILEPIIYQFTNSGVVVLLIQTILSTLFVLFFAEFLPKALLRINPNRTLAVAAIPLKIVYIIIYPFNYLTIGLSNAILKLFKIDTSYSNMAFSKIDLEHFVMDIQERQEEGEEIDHEIQIFKNALDFSEVKARECMIHRTEIIAMNVEESIENLREKFMETGLSKILIYRDNIDNIIGYTHSLELFKKPETIKSMLLPVAIIPESMPANEILKQFIKQRRSMAVVVDEFGGTSGVITMEDIVEEIFGEIEDEYDVEELVEIQENETTFQFSAKTEIDYINEKYKLALPESEDYETLGGLVINLHESIPEKNEVITFKNYTLTINEVSENKIELITLEVVDR
ncbi:MAG: HlyC/CorC family transporter [Flavobacteriales bacterium]|nr:HlyC/CorC family transporter [Flavobacteriales bacterium]MCB9363701.1 HlyC/CorC family transporter [Flavobacteriales bacterium]